MRAVLFDLDNTLIDRDGAFRACLAETFAEAPVRAQLEALDQGGHGPREALFSAWSRHSGTAIDQTIFTTRLLAHIGPDPEFLEALEALSRRLPLAIVSNGGSITQRGKMRAAGLDRVLTQVVVSAEVGLEKPDPRIFHLACQRLGVPPEECLFIGDQEELDGSGARAAGLQFIRVDSVLNAERLARLVAL